MWDFILYVSNFLSIRKHRVLRAFTIRGQGGKEGISMDEIALASQYLRLKGSKKVYLKFLKALSICSLLFCLCFGRKCKDK